MNEEKLCRRCEEPLEDRIPGCPLQCGTETCTSYKKKPRYDYSKILIIWVIGGPGCGKDAQSAKIAAKYGYIHLSCGNLLREEVARGTDRAKCLMSVLEHGTLAPGDLVLGLIKQSMESRYDVAKGFVIEGYPRELRQGIAFEKTIAPVNAVIYLEAPREVLVQRLMTTKKPATDAVEFQNFINTRLKAFYDNYKKVLAQFPNVITKINAELSPDDIFGQAVTAIDNAIQQMLERARQKEKEDAQ